MTLRFLYGVPALSNRAMPKVRQRSWLARHLVVVALTMTLVVAQAAEPLRVVGTGGRIGSGSFTVSGTANAFRQRTPHKLGGPVSEIDVGFMNWAHSTTAEVANSNAVTIDYAWIERASTGQVVPLTFSGQRQLVMPANSADPFYLADPVSSTTWTGEPPIRDELFWVHTKGTIPPDGKVCQGTPASYAGAKFIVFDPANDPATKDVAGVVPSIPGQKARTVGLPMLFLGRFTGPGHLAVIGLGDSILDGLGDAANPAPAISGYGFFNRAAVDEAGKNTIAMMNLTRSGETAATWVGNHSRQIQILPFANVVVEEFGTNDIGANGVSANAEAIFGRIQRIWAIAREAKVQKIVRTQLLPRTASASKQWSSPADQMPNPGWGVGAARDQVNARLATAFSQQKTDVLVATLAPVSDLKDNSLWLSNGTAHYMTKDGTHPGPAGYALLAVPLRAALLGITVD